jgi:uncharacterized membrane protein
MAGAVGAPSSTSRNPSRLSERLSLAVAALCGLGIAGYLVLVQLGLAAAWDPIFGRASSVRVLTSSLSRALPVPDAAIGAAAYAAEAVLACIGGEERWRTRPWIAVAYGVLALALGAGSVVLVFVQVALVRSGCTLCLASAAISIGIAAVAQQELRPALGVLRGRHREREYA